MLRPFSCPIWPGLLAGRLPFAAFGLKNARDFDGESPLLKAATAVLLAGLALLLDGRSRRCPGRRELPPLRLPRMPAAPWRHATSLIGEPKYPEGFTHYDYVNPAAPKGGTLNTTVIGIFDSFNPYIVQGNVRRPVSRNPAAACTTTA